MALPPINNSSPQITAFLTSGLGGPDKSNNTGIPGTGAPDPNVKLSAFESDSDASKYMQQKTLVDPGKAPTIDTDDAATQRLVNLAIESTKDGPAASFLGKILLQSADRQRESKTQEMVTARQTAQSLSMSAAGQLAQSGKDLMSAGVKSLALGLTGAAFHSVNKHTEAGAAKSTTIDAGSKLFDRSSEFTGTQGQSESKLDESQQKVDESNSEMAGMVADRAKAALDKIDENCKQTNDFVKELQDTNNDMMAAITKG